MQKFGESGASRPLLRAVGLLLLLLAGGCASRGALPPTPPQGSAALGDGASIAATALAFRGVPYRSGGADPSGFDCSGLVQYVFAQHALGMPRTVREQFEIGRSLRRGRLRAGDLVFFATSGDDVSHVGIAVDGDRFVHAPSTRGSVRVESLESEYWRERFAGARRVE